MKVIFLDIDGVLNSNPFLRQRIGTIDRVNVSALNYLLEKTGAKLVLSSSWRGFVGRGRMMSLRAFAFVLRTHGLKSMSLLIDKTPHDIRGGTPDENDRARQCREWLDAHPEVTASVAIDDCDYDFGAVAIPFVMTDPELGLAMGEARKAADLLNN